MQLDVENLCAAATASVARSPEQPQRLPRAAVGNPCRHDRGEDPEAALGELLPAVPRAAPDGREGVGRRHSGGLYPGRLHPLGGRAGEAMGMSGISRARCRGCARRSTSGSTLSSAARSRATGRTCDRRDLRERARGRADRLQGGNNRRGRELRRRARAARHGDRALGGRTLLDGLPALADAPWPAWREAGDLRCARGAEGRSRQGARRHLAALQGPLPAQTPLAHAGKGQRQMVLAAINTAFAQESFDTASAQWRLVADQLRGKFPKLAELMDGAETDVLAFMTFPKAHRTQIHSTNRSSGSTPRSSGAPTSSASSRMKPRSLGSSARCYSSRTTSGSCSGATCRLRRCGP